MAIAATDDILADLLTPGVQGISQVANSAVPANLACSPVAGKQLCRGSIFDNYERAEMFNISLSSIYNFGPRLSFDSLFGVVEVASQHIRGSSLKYTAYDGSERVYTSAADKAYVTGNGDDWQIDRDSYGYTLLLSGSWNDVFAGRSCRRSSSSSMTSRATPTGLAISSRTTKPSPWGWMRCT